MCGQFLQAKLINLSKHIKRIGLTALLVITSSVESHQIFSLERCTKCNIIHKISLNAFWVFILKEVSEKGYFSFP